MTKEIQNKGYYGPDDRSVYRVPPENADVEKRLELMDKYGVDVNVLSLTSGTLTGLSKEEAMRLCKISNDGMAKFCEKRPDRFVGLVAVSLRDVEIALNELDRGIEDLGFKGVILATNQEGNGLDAPEYHQFFERVCKHDVPVFLHPTNWKSYPLVDEHMMTAFGWPFDTTQAVWRLIVGGVLDKFPSLKVVTHHMGAMLPYLNRRAVSYSGQLKRKNITEYWRQIYGDTAIDGAFESMSCGYAFFGSRRMIFGSDYPFGAESGEAFVRNNLACVEMMSIPQEEKMEIFSENAKRLLKI